MLSTERELLYVNLPSTAGILLSVECKLIEGNLRSAGSKIPRAGSKLSEAKLPSDNLPPVEGILHPVDGKLTECNLPSEESKISRTEGKLLEAKLHPL